MTYQIEKLKEKMWTGLAWALPKQLVYWCSIRLMAHATVGDYGNTDPSTLNAMDALKRWETA